MGSDSSCYRSRCTVVLNVCQYRYNPKVVDPEKPGYKRLIHVQEDPKGANNLHAPFLDRSFYRNPCFNLAKGDDIIE